MKNNNDLIKKIKELKKLEAAGQPQEGWVLSSRELLMSQVGLSTPQNDEFKEADQQPNYYWQYISNWMGARVMKPIAVIAVALMMFFGYSATITVADSSLPGDVFYSVKTTSERVQLAFTFSDEKKIHLQMDFVSRRAGELQELAKQDNAQGVSQTAKKITANAKSVQDRLNKITLASTGDSVIELAKEIDSKTLKVNQTLVLATQTLSQGVKEEVTGDIKEAINQNDETGESALGLIVNRYEEGESNITDDEVTSRLAGRIKQAEEGIEVVVTEAEESTEELGEVATSTVSGIKTQATTSTEAIIESTDGAQEKIEEAKDLLDNKDFGLVLEKIKESKGIGISIVIIDGEEQGEVKGAEDVNTDGASTTAEMEIEIEDTVEETSESTDSIVN